MDTETPHLAVSLVFDAPRALEIRQWRPAHLAGPGSQGWLEAFEKLDATLLHLQAIAADVEV